MLELPLELCYIKMQGFSCKLVNGVSLLPSFMHRLEARLLAAQLRHMLSQSYPAATRLSIDRVRICFAQSLVNLVQALMCFNQSGAGIRNCTRPLLGMKVENQVIKKQIPCLYIYKHGSQFFWKIHKKLLGLCWVFHDIWWFFDSFFANTQTWWFFDPDFFANTQNQQFFQKWKTCTHWFQCVLLLCCSTTRPNSAVPILCCLSSSLQDPGLGFRSWDFNTQISL